jgi:CRP/FNR family transcriptional regulator
VIEDFPGLEDLEPDAKALLAVSAQQAQVPSGTVVFSSGNRCENYFLVTEGSVRVQMVSQNGREIILYRVESGQTCIMTTACLMSHQDYCAEAITESDVKAVMIPGITFQKLIDGSVVFRTFVFSSYSTRLADLLMLVEEVAFHRVDVRLAKFLLDRGGDQGQLIATHQDLAAELGSAREVISRQLKEFEKRGWVNLQRGRIDLLQKSALAALCD